MAYKYLKDLTYDEVKEFLKHTSDYDEKLFDRAMDMAYDSVEEYLYGAPRAVSYQYFGRGEYFKIRELNNDVKKWFDNIQASYEWLDENTLEEINRAYELWQKDYEDGLSDEEYSEYESLIDDIEDSVLSKMKAEYDWAIDADDDYPEIFVNDIEYFEPDYEDIYVDTDTWEIHNINDESDENYGIVDEDLSEQLTFL